MEHLREIVEEEAKEPPDVHKLILSDPSLTRDVSTRGRERGKVRATRVPSSASLGAARSLVGKLDMLHIAPPKGCSSGRVNDGIRLLKDDVEQLSSYLDELLEVEELPPTAKCWMNEARDLSYKMEDYIDNLFVANNTRILRKFFNYVKTPWELKRTVYKFRIYVQEAIQRYEVYVLSYFNVKNSLRHRFVSLGPMLPTPYEDIVIDDQINEVIGLLANNEDQQIKVVSVLGSACLGKTTLATMVYNKIGKQYSSRAFIRVPRKPDMKSIFRDILSQLQQQQHPPEDCKEVDLIDMIKEYLQDKRYLIIIDDVWTAFVWDIINHALPKGGRGSRIITTTEIEDVALTCSCYQPERVFVMKPLDDHHSKKLFFSRAFGSESDCPEEFRDVCTDIVEICGGLPLATVSIASLLASQPVISIDLLKYIHQSLSSRISSASSTSERTRQALNLSFNNLPNYLKTCLMYLSMYPQGYKFCKDDLVKQYVAEDFIDTTEGQDIHKVAESYINQLIDRRFIKPVSMNYNNEVLSCAVHDAVHDLIAYKSVEENFIVALDYSQKKVPISHNVRRLSLLFDNARYAKKPSNIKSSQVRSLAYSGLLECMPCMKEFKLLRVLNLQLFSHGRRGGDTVDLTGISKMFQLRYLKITCDVCIKLPKQMGVLRYLETLDVRDATITDVPWIHLPHLLHLSLPVERHLLDWIFNIGFVSLATLGKVNCLQDLHLTIPSVPPSDNQERIMEALGHCLIGGHGNLKTFVVAHGYSIKNGALGGTSKVAVSWHNMAPPPRLERFECSPHSCIIFYKIPPWVKMLVNLCILKIAVRDMQMSCVDILRGLPALIALSLYVETAPYEKIIFDKSGFSVLMYFKLRFMSGIARIIFLKDAMPDLLKLKLGFNAIPQVDQYEHGIISIGRMPSVKEISAKFGGAASDGVYDLVKNHPSNPKVKRSPDKSEETESPPPGIIDVKIFTLYELIDATSNFSRNNILGEDDFGHIYKGTVVGFGPIAAVNGHKWTTMYQQTDLRDLGMMQHPHLVRLLGYCYQDEHRILVYEYMPKGSLKHHLLENPPVPLPWSTRLNIAVGVAEGLAFLQEHGKRISYSGLKASNILLDSDYTAKLWGFRPAMDGGVRKDGAYILTAERDVYYFLGVVLLELLSGQPCMDKNRNLVQCSRSYMYLLDTGQTRKLPRSMEPTIEDKLRRIMDPSLEGRYSSSAAWSTAQMAHRCLHDEEPPSMHEILDALEPLLDDHAKDGPRPRIGMRPPKESVAKRRPVGAVQGRGKAKQQQAKEVDQPTTRASNSAVTPPMMHSAPQGSE
ncbi:disease resistance protein RGA5-like isoform X2 [Triticum urartu]|uniref:disease resistance protein RGA5-like isoform X2 n=1 Tax=Triticum urartu TaxID=4572 RepID=UPI002042EA16|nr:disease resistance protein RGA5-like isoform X2 [Triticum urartu]